MPCRWFKLNRTNIVPRNMPESSLVDPVGDAQPWKLSPNYPDPKPHGDIYESALGGSATPQTGVTTKGWWSDCGCRFVGSTNWGVVSPNCPLLSGLKQYINQAVSLRISKLLNYHHQSHLAAQSQLEQTFLTLFYIFPLTSSTPQLKTHSIFISRSPTIMSSPASTTIAFFGATGGCTSSCLAHTLQQGYTAVALARTPSKLTTQLLAHGIDQAVIDKQLTIVQGNATDVAAVKDTLVSRKDGTLVSKIVFGIGGTPKLQASLRSPATFENPEVCRQATETIQSALREVYTETPALKDTKPFLSFISTTGISDGPEDVPMGFRSLYHVLLATPHADKRRMEGAITSNMNGQEEDRLYRGFTGIRPSFLVGDGNIKSAAKGWKALKVGTEKNPAVGYTICRSDVGQWIFEETVKKDGEEYFGKMVTLTGWWRVHDVSNFIQSRLLFLFLICMLVCFCFMISFLLVIIPILSGRLETVHRGTELLLSIWPFLCYLQFHHLSFVTIVELVT